MKMLITLLKQNPLFSSFTDSDLVLLLQMCEPIRLKKGDAVFQEDQQDDGAVYFIEEGIIKIFKESKNQRKILAMFGVGNMFGEMSFISPGPRSASAVADEEAGLCKFLPAKFDGLVAHDPALAIKLLKVLASKIISRLRQTDDVLMGKSQKIIIT